MITFKQYLQKVYENIAISEHQRYGQILFNTLFELEPNLAKDIASTNWDPYYSDDPEVHTKFILWLIEELEYDNATNNYIVEEI